MTALLPKWTAEELAAWALPEQLSVTEWADRFRILDQNSVEPGAYRSTRTPYAIEWMNNATTPWVRQTTIIAGTQMGKTESINNAVAFAICQDPAPAMFVLPRNADVATTQQRRIMPMILATPALRDELTDKLGDAKKREIAFKRSTLYLRSSQSPADLASVPARYLFFDECDKYPAWSGKEAAPLELARERQKNFWNSVTYVVTTPTTREGVGWREFDDGDRRRFWVPCPLCGAFQVLKWAQVRYPEGITAREMRRTRCATYHCERCADAIPDLEKTRMLERGVWVPEAFTFEAWTQGGDRERDRADHRSYHIWSGYSPWQDWSKIASQFLKMKARPDTLMNWVNSWLAELWEDRVEAPTEDSITRAILPGFAMGKVPDGVLLATAGVDVQKDGLWVVVRGWGWNDESWLLYATKVATFAELDDVLFRHVWCAKGVGVRAGVIDSRHRRGEVLDFVRRRPAIRMGVGVDRHGPLDFTTHKLERHPDTGVPLEHSLLVWSITVGNFKDLVASRMQRPQDWHIPIDVPDYYRAQVTAEHKVRKRSRNREVELWVTKPGSAQNHCWDCEVYAAAAAKMIGVDMLKRVEGEATAATNPEGPPRRPRDGGFPRLSR